MQKIITIGFDIPGFSNNFYSYNSSQSLLDADIIVFCPDFSCYDYYESFKGKPSFDESNSFQAKEASFHWSREITTALQEGKTVFIIMAKYEEIYVQTGRTEYSGTGRNARATNFVETFNNYEFLPVKIPTLLPKEGKEIVFSNDPIFASFWREFKDYLVYESYIDGKMDKPLFFTKTGNKPIGGLIKSGNGNLILLPQLFLPDSFDRIENKGTKNEIEYWSDEAIQFGNRLVENLVNIDGSLRSLVEATPAPQWTQNRIYLIGEETHFQEQIINISKKMDALFKEKSCLSDRLKEEGGLRELLYEKGKPLERAIIRALNALGYKAENYEDENLELDQIIISPEGNRFVGESEGKDNSAINIDKFRQLESNIQEDLQREEVSEAAIGILFGNGFRLTSPEERKEQFTEKCIINAERLKAVLVRTTDLFCVAKYVKETNDQDYALKCRKAILNYRGKIVEFPKMEL